MLLKKRHKTGKTRPKFWEGATVASMFFLLLSSSNPAPGGANDSNFLVTQMDQPVELQFQEQNRDDFSEVTISIIEEPKHGVVVNTGKSHFYFPERGFSGEDAISVKLCVEAKGCEEKELRLLIREDEVCSLEDLDIPTSLILKQKKGFYVDDLEKCEEPIGLKIFNRWGDLVLESKDYRLQNNWNGHHKESGEPLSIGQYFYVFTSSTREKTVQGHLEIEKN